jgi:predicted CopG family antitoxin
METMKMTTITISEKTRGELLKVAAELQSKRGEKVDYEDAIEWLLLRSKRNPEFLRRAMVGSGVPSEEFRKILREGREEDRRHEEALERHLLGQG